MRSLRTRAPFVSLPAFAWEHIPAFAVLAGRNGVGKSQLLRLLASGLIGAGSHTRSDISPLGLTIDGEVAQGGMRGDYVPALFTLSEVDVDYGMFTPVTNLVDTARRPAPHEDLERTLRAFFGMYAISPSGGRSIDEAVTALIAAAPTLRHADVFEWLEPFALVWSGKNALESLARMIYSHANYRELHRTEGWSKPLPPDPAELANRHLRRFGQAFCLESPSELRLPYSLRCRLPGDRWILPSELSSGEQAILLLVATIVTADLRAFDDRGRPALLLLDEPDAHIHTELIKLYLDALASLAGPHRQILLVTHRPETMLLCPPDSLVELRRTDGQLTFEPVPPAKRPALIARLAGDTVAVLPSVRVVLVEDEDDRVFYEQAYQLALTFPSADLPRHPPLAFMAVMAKPSDDGKSNSRPAGGGGWSAVVARMQDLAAQQLQMVFRGLIDGDGRRDAPPLGILRLERYSIESFWADPLGLYEWSVRRDDVVGRGLAAAGGLALSDLGDLRHLDAARLQPVVEATVTLLEAKLPPALSRERRDCALHRKNGVVTLSYPAWLWTATKDQLEAAVTAAFSGAIRTPWKNAAQVVACLPSDLITIFHCLITERT
jgi:energy-coupling factor transporter ATP-binding protein EcfA2